MHSTLFPEWEKDCITIVHNPAGVQGDNFSYSHEYCIYAFPKQKNMIGKTERQEESEEAFRDWGGTCSRSLAKNCFYPIIVKNNEIIGFGDVCSEDFHPSSANIHKDDITYVYPIGENGEERKWVFARNSVENIIGELSVKNRNGEISIIRTKTVTSYKTVWNDKKFYANIYGSKLLNNIFGTKKFDFPKSLYTVQECLFAVNSFRSKTSICLDYFAGSGTTGHAVINLNREDGGKRKYILVEMGNYFDTVLKPRIQKVVYSKEWKDGKPTARETGISHCFKYIRLESYEDTLNNLELRRSSTQEQTLFSQNTPQDFREQYMLHYMLDVESQNSLLNFQSFAEPMNYQLKIKKPGSDESRLLHVDLMETFNWLVGLTVEHIAAPQAFHAQFERDSEGRLRMSGRLKQEGTGRWWFRRIEGVTPDGRKTLIVWRNLTGNLEEDNLVLDTYMREKLKISTRDFEFDLIYVNGSNNLENLKIPDDTWKVRLIEEDFHRLMFETEGN